MCGGAREMDDTQQNTTDRKEPAQVYSLNESIAIGEAETIVVCRRPPDASFSTIADAAQIAAETIEEARAMKKTVLKLPPHTPVALVAFRVAANSFSFTTIGQKSNKVSASTDSLSSSGSKALIKDKALRAIVVSLRSSCRYATISPVLFMAADPTETPSSTLTAIYPCQRGNLEEVLSQLRFPLNPVVKASMCRDLTAALAFLHSGAAEKDGKRVLSPAHGAVTSHTLYVDFGWRLKVGGFGGGLGTRIWPDDLPERLFIAPEHVKSDGDVISASLSGDVYSAAIVMNMILSDSEWPYLSANPPPSVQYILSSLPSDTDSVLRPKIAQCGDEMTKLIMKCWNYNPSMRPSSSDLLAAILKLHPFLPSYPMNEESTGTLLSGIMYKDSCSYASQLSILQQHHLARELEKVSENAADANSKFHEEIKILTAERESLRGTADRLRGEMQRSSDLAEKEATRLRGLLSGLKREVANARHGLLPWPLAELMVINSFNDSGSDFSTAGTALVDSMFQPTVYESVTLLVASISGFNKHIQQLSTAPRLLADLLKAYYRGIENAIDEASALAGIRGENSSSFTNDYGPTDRVGFTGLNGSSTVRPRVHVIERIADACILVSGSPDRSDTHAEDIVEVAVRLMEWSSKFDASSILGGGTRVNLRVGIHSGPVTAAIVGQMPKFLLMGETVNLTSGIESLCSIQEIRVSAVTQAMLQSKGYLFEQRQDVDLRSRGRMGTFTLLATPRGQVSGQGASNAIASSAMAATPSLAAAMAITPTATKFS